MRRRGIIGRVKILYLRESGPPIDSLRAGESPRSPLTIREACFRNSDAKDRNKAEGKDTGGFAVEVDHTLLVA